MTAALADQARWDGYAAAARAEPVTESPVSHWAEWPALSALLSPLAGRRVVELGCGNGKLAVWMAKQGAAVTAIDIGPALVHAGRTLAAANGVAVDFRQGSVTGLQLPSASFDLAVGLSVLHHLTPSGVRAALREARRVLAPGGVAVFVEPVEDSPAFAALQNLIPVPAYGGGRPRPSSLDRKAWREYVESLDDRDLTTAELRDAATAAGFTRVSVRHHGLLFRLHRLLPLRCRGPLMRLDRLLLRFPPLRRFAQTALLECRG